MIESDYVFLQGIQRYVAYIARNKRNDNILRKHNAKRYLKSLHILSCFIQVPVVIELEFVMLGKRACKVLLIYMCILELFGGNKIFFFNKLGKMCN